MGQMRQGWVLLLAVVLLGIFAFFGLQYRKGEKGDFPICGAATAWVEEKWGEVWGS